MPPTHANEAPFAPEGEEGVPATAAYLDFFSFPLVCIYRYVPVWTAPICLPKCPPPPSLLTAGVLVLSSCRTFGTCNSQDLNWLRVFVLRLSSVSLLPCAARCSWGDGLPA